MPDNLLESLKNMPEASGNALGLARLVILFADAAKLDDVWRSHRKSYKNCKNYNNFKKYKDKATIANMTEGELDSLHLTLGKYKKLLWFMVGK